MRSRPLRSRQTQIFEQHPTGLCLLDGVGGQREADGVTDTFVEQGSDACHTLDETARERTGLGDAKVKRVVDLVGEQPI